MSLSRDKATQGKAKTATTRPGSSEAAGPEWAQQRLQRIEAMLGVGVELTSALVIELIRSMTVRPVDVDALGHVFDHAAEAVDVADEIFASRAAAEKGDYQKAIATLQSYLHRTLVEEVPIADRRLRRSPRFTRESQDSSLLKH